jgi:hypothetical protein
LRENHSLCQFPRRRESSYLAKILDSRLRGNDKKSFSHFLFNFFYPELVEQEKSGQVQPIHPLTPDKLRIKIKVSKEYLYPKNIIYAGICNIFCRNLRQQN